MSEENKMIFNNYPLWPDQANKLARYLISKYDCDEYRLKASDYNDLLFSSCKIPVLKNFCGFDTSVYLFLDESKIEINRYNRGNFVDTNSYEMDKRTKRRAKRDVDTMHAIAKGEIGRRGIGFLVIFCAGMLSAPWLGIWVSKNISRQKKIREQYNEYKASLPDYTDSIRLAQTPEEFARFKNLQEFREHRLDLYWEELQNEK